MDNYQIGIIIALMSLSIAFWLVPSLIGIIKKILIKPSAKGCRKSGVSKMLLFSACLIGSVWCLRYAVGYYGIVTSESPAEELTWGEEIFNSLVHSLQTFSMDEDYTQYILDGKAMLRGIFGEDTALQTVYGIYASVLNFIAPVAGGAVIFEILASIFPKIKLAISLLMLWRPKYYFSELNEASLALAKSIIGANTSALKAPIIIFTDAYADNENEKALERLTEARMLGAVCVKEDLFHIKKNNSCANTIFLIDEQEVNNLSALSHLVQNEEKRFLEATTIYLFSQSDAYIEIKQSARSFLLNEKGFSKNKLPKIIPIQRYRNLITNLLTDVPLYEPLVSKRNTSNGKIIELNITILGTGEIGTEMFLSCYWFAQMLNVKTTISIVSNEAEKDFWGKINSLNSEIKSTCKMESDYAQSELLKYNSERYSQPYCYVNYTEQNVFSDAFIESINSPEDKLITNADYILVSLGSDEDNISAANKICNHLGLKSMKSESKHKTVMAYVVYDTNLSASLNRQMWRSFESETSCLYMRAIGCFEELYGRENILMKKFDEKIEHITHCNEVLDADYSFWADGARKMHRKYKAFSADLVRKSIFDFKNDPDGYEIYGSEVISRYKELAFGECEGSGTDRYFSLLHKLAWLEHRRWNAFTRVRGFKSTYPYDHENEDGCWLYEKYYEFTGSYKHWALKLHPCIVECDEYGIRTDISNDKIDNVKIKKREENLSQENDNLDKLSVSLHGHNLIQDDFKYWDYPCNDKFDL